MVYEYPKTIIHIHAGACAAWMRHGSLSPSTRVFLVPVTKGQDPSTHVDSRAMIMRYSCRSSLFLSHLRDFLVFHPTTSFFTASHSHSSPSIPFHVSYFYFHNRLMTVVDSFLTLVHLLLLPFFCLFLFSHHHLDPSSISRGWLCSSTLPSA